jgi:ATP-dependent DNA helicase RecG
MLALSSPITSLKMGKQLAVFLKRLGLETIQDLLFYFPFRYEDWSRVVPIKDLRPGETATIKGRVELIENKRSRWKRMLLTEAIIADESGSLTVGWFHQPYLTKILKVGDEIYLSGRVAESLNGEWQMISPVYEKVQEKTLHTARIVPIYSTTGRLTQKQLRFLIKQAMNAAYQLREWLPFQIISQFKIMPLIEGIKEIHFPTSLEKAEKARRRFKFEELFLLQLLAQILRRDLEESYAPPIAFHQEITKNFVESLPFRLTNDQRKAAWEILKDMSKSRPMNRLLQGEVGSGKTVVAALAILNTVKSGYQVAYLAPTEILARQQFETLSFWFKPFGISVGLLTHSYQEGENLDYGVKHRKEFRNLIARGEIQVVIGTHALLEEKIQFKNLGLAIIDEQHRFGVEQRKLLREKSGWKNNSFPRVLPHLLSMTATPIPRTLSLVFYGDLDLSFLRELPQGRKKVITYLVSDNSFSLFSQTNQTKNVLPLSLREKEEVSLNLNNIIWKREDVYEFIRQEIGNNHRVFVLCPLIDVSDKFGYRSVKEEYEKLQKDIFPEIEIGILHGRLKSEEKEEVIKDFRSGKKPILVTTTVIEVGVNVPEATVMVIEGAERFGLAQLHQLRGRIGRGKEQAYCFLMVENPTDFALARLKAFLECEDGFALAERDLELRGPGEIWGTAQSGFPEFKIASIKDVDILEEARLAAQEIIKKDPNLKDHLLLREKMVEFVKMIKGG